jgi:hypothetical protein
MASVLMGPDNASTDLIPDSFLLSNIRPLQPSALITRRRYPLLDSLAFTGQDP